MTTVPLLSRISEASRLPPAPAQRLEKTEETSNVTQADNSGSPRLYKAVTAA